MAIRQFLRTWSKPPRLTKLLIAVAIVVFFVEGFYAVFWRENDYSVHLRYGSFFLEGEPYQSDGATAYYPVGRLWMDASLASLPYYLGRALCYVAALCSLGLTLRMWAILASRAVPIPREKQVAAVGWTLLVLSPLIIRDLDECGLQLFLLFFLTAAGYSLAHRWHGLCGFWLGVAIIYKATPLLFLPLLLWKRQWRAAGWTVLFTVVLSLLPATYSGWQATLEDHAFWWERTAHILENQEAYPSVAGIEPPKVQNESLQALVARYLTSYEPGHPLYVDHPLFWQFGSLTGERARYAVKGVILLLGMIIGWRMWGPWHRRETRNEGRGTGNERDWSGKSDSGLPNLSPRFAPDWAVACLFAALLSPLCWRQHLVVAIPCAYLVARERLQPGASLGWRKWLTIAAAWIILGSRREIWGDDLSLVWLSYKLDTMAVLSYVLLCLTLPSRGASAYAEVEPESAVEGRSSRLVRGGELAA